MDKKQIPDTRENDAKLEAAIKRAEAEVDRVKAWMAREQKGIDSRQSSRATGDVPTRAKEPSRPVREAQAARGESLGVLNNIFEEQRKSGVMAWRQFGIAIIAVIIATLGLIINSNRNTQTVVGKLEQGELAITDPPDNASVGLGQKVRGTTPYVDLNHYLVVTAVRTATSYVQPAFVSADRTLSGDARFGDANAGEDDEFTVRVLATKSRLEMGILANVPDDAKVSRPVTVRRTKPTEQIIISTPADGEDVGLDAAITGKTYLKDLNHYVVVKSLKVGTSYVQDRPPSINRNDGTFIGNARFGRAALGIGEQFMVRVLATRSTLPAAPLTNEPPDAVFSNSVTVTRKQ
jgi:hypothetical protein